MSGEPGRSRSRRARRRDAEPPPAPTPSPKRGRPLLALVLGRASSRRARRTIVASAIGLALLVLAVPLGLWMNYHWNHVVSDNAIVKGAITQVGAQLDGVVTSVEVDAGQRVTAGQVLARFEDHQLQATVLRAQSKLEQAQRGLEVEHLAIAQERRRLAGLVTEATARAAAADAQLDAARSLADEAEDQYELKKTLARDGLIAQQELRSAENAHRTAEAKHATALADRGAAEAGRQLAVVESDGVAVRARRLDVLDSEVAAYRAELALAQADLQAALIRAPSDGWVVRRIAEPGASVVVGQPVVSLWIGHDVWVEAWIDENDLAKVDVGSPVRVTVKPFPDRVFHGRVETIGVSTDYELPEAAVPQPRNQRMRGTPVVCARVKLDDPDGLFPGLSAVVAIEKGNHAEAASRTSKRGRAGDASAVGPSTGP